MVQKSSYEHGQFSWVDLASIEMDSAAEFYGKIFGWTANRQQTGGGPPYAEFLLEGKKVGGLGQLDEAMKAQGIPPSWNSYITVRDIERVTTKAAELGATITVPVMTIPEAGSLAFFRDPTGGQVGLWQADRHFGAAVCNEAGSFCWTELATRDIEKAREFFGELLGWTFEKHTQSPTQYYIAQVNGNPNGGLMQMNEEWGEVPPHWMVYFTVADVDATSERVRQAGGSVCVPAFDISVGRIAVMTDPQGAAFSLLQHPNAGA